MKERMGLEVNNVSKLYSNCKLKFIPEKNIEVNRKTASKISLSSVSKGAVSLCFPSEFCELSI